MMERCDQDLAFMLQYENVAWYENGKVRIPNKELMEKFDEMLQKEESLDKKIDNVERKEAKLQDHIQQLVWEWHWQHTK